ncbi:3D domain-containing protein [Niameybacter massiliensis]|uniref:3D domain-containing protein n=1 Tax=Holtiella tumoricola TaxID=3018743 RepID=A0AA42J003_9FIRM|nr:MULTISPECIES: 3D domain-containing protein [Lachnospirales]MDA3730952.1 3D domain-containing protein [Holtiella tumoricola]
MKNRIRIALLIVALFMLGTGTITAYQSLSKTVAIVEDGKVTQYETLHQSVSDILAAQEIVLGDKDEVEPSMETAIEDGMKITVTRWKPTVVLTVNGSASTFKTSAMTVGELIDNRHIKLDEHSEVTPALDTPITDDVEVSVKTREVAVEVVQEEIPFEKTVEEVTTLAAGELKVIEQGATGLKEKTVEIVRFGGEVQSETVKEEFVIKEPVTKVVQEGKKNIIKDSATGKMYEYTKALTLEATAYTDVEGDQWSGKTASGMPTFVGMVAVDPKIIPLGTVLYVEGYGIAIAGDTGGAIKGYDIDLFMNTNSECKQFGRRSKQVYILQDQNVDVRAERKNY